MRIKIVSDGTVNGTRITNAATGERLEHVTAIEWRLDVEGGFATATLQFAMVELEGIARVDADED